MVLHEKGRFQIVRERNSYKIQDPNDYQNSHTHNIKSFNMAKTIIHNVIYRRTPKTKNTYLLESHIRLSNSKKYKRTIKLLIDKANDKQRYVNSQRGVI